MSEHKLMVFDGVNKSGKGRNVEMLMNRLNNVGVPATSIREPGGTPVGEEIRGILLNSDIPRPPETDVLLFNAARAATIQRIGELLVDQSVVADRSYLATLAFQMHGDGVDEKLTRSSCNSALAGKYNWDAFFVLDIPYETFIARSKPSDEQDYFERGGEREYFERVREGFLKEGKAIGAIIVDATGQLDEVHEHIWEKVEGIL